MYNKPTVGILAGTMEKDSFIGIVLGNQIYLH